MSKIYVFGHKKPDTDAVTSAISLSYLKREKGFDCEPRVLGRLSNETKFALNYFNVKYPKFLNDVKNQIKDVNYNRVMFYEKESIRNCYERLKKEKFNGAPVVDYNEKLNGIITLNDITTYLMDGDITKLNTSYSNILDVLDAKEILKFDDEIRGNILIAAYRSSTFLDNIELNSNTILIVGDRHSIIEYAIESRVKLIVVVGCSRISEELITLAKENKVNIISTINNSLTTSKLISQSNYISDIIITKDPIKFIETAYIGDFIETAKQTKHTTYPIVDKRNTCLGFLRLVDVGDKKNKKVILVDHNEMIQSADGIEDADIIEIIDHHKLGSLKTNNPINFRNMAVGSTNTIIYKMYEEDNVVIPKNIAGIMLSGIISDTLLLKSPTTTELDRIAVKNLSAIAGVDYEVYGLEMFKAGSSIKGKTLEEILFSDFKVFKVGSIDSGIGQIFTTNFESLKLDLSKMVDVMNKVAINNEYNLIALFITDIMKNGSYILYNDRAKNVLEDSFGIENLYQGKYLDGIVSRKKQVIPSIIEVLERKQV